MASSENGKESKLKLIHLVYGLIAAGVLAGMALGMLMNQQQVNTSEIDKKLEREIFDMHNQQQVLRFEKTDALLEKMDGKLDNISAKIK